MNRSGKLLASNDNLIFELINDSNFKIHRNGKIYSVITKTGKISKNKTWRQVGTILKQGYFTVSYKNKKLLVQRVIYAKFGKLKLTPDLVINHIDSNPLNNFHLNLELVTQSRNMYHAFENGKTAVIGNKKINQEIANEIRKLRLKGYNYAELCEKFNLCKSTISYIVNNKTWVLMEGK